MWVFINPTSQALSMIVLGPGAVLVVLPGDLADLFLGEVVRQLAQVFLLVGQGEVNHWSELLLSCVSCLERRRGATPPIDWSVNQRKGYRMAAPEQ